MRRGEEDREVRRTGGDGEVIIEEGGRRGEEEGTRVGEGRFNIARHMHKHL